MPSMDNLQIDLMAASRKGEVLHFELADDFFSSLDQDEICGGEVLVGLRVRSLADGCYQLDFSIRGYVSVICDRCLDELKREIDVSDSVKVTEYDTEDPDVKSMTGKNGLYDISWDVYEMTELSLPIQRVHPEGECNEDMLSRLVSCQA